MRDRLDDGVPIERVGHSPATVARFSEFFIAKGWLCVLCGEFFMPHSHLERHFDREHLRYSETV